MATCKICGGEIDTRNGYSQMMLKEQLCYHCFFWKQHYEDDKKRPAYTWAVINGEHYILEPHTNESVWAGCAGAMHKIKFNDGTVVECDNLWHQGKISKEWLEKFPDNAEFIASGKEDWFEDTLRVLDHYVSNGDKSNLTLTNKDVVDEINKKDGKIYYYSFD